MVFLVVLPSGQFKYTALSNARGPKFIHQSGVGGVYSVSFETPQVQAPITLIGIRQLKYLFLTLTPLVPTGSRKIPVADMEQAIIMVMAL